MSIAIIVPYRDRKSHLKQFVPHMHRYFNKRNFDEYEILVVEQTPGKKFNRSKLLNIGVEHAMDNHHTVTFHDIDMLPIDAEYEEADNPTHLAGRAQQFGWKKPYPLYFGGVTSVSVEDFVKVNGFSNEYWGWGAEDDDFRERCKREGLDLTWHNYRFKSLPHDRSDQNHNELKNSRKRFHTFRRGEPGAYDHTKEGFNTLEYELIKKAQTKGYTYIKADI